MASPTMWHRAWALVLVPCLFLGAANQAWASGVPKALRADTNSIQAVMQNDGWVQGTIRGVGKDNSLNMDLKVAQMAFAMNQGTVVDVGPYAADTSFLVPGNTAKVYFHLDPNGNPVADVIVIAPTVVKGSLANVTNVDAKTQVLLVETAANVPGGGPNGSGAAANGSGNVNVDVTSATKVQIVPPWDASQGLSAVTQLVAIGVLGENGDLLAAVIVGVVAAN